MIEASVMRTVWNDGKTGYEVKAKGHAGAGKYGQDIVCAAVSCLMADPRQRGGGGCAGRPCGAGCCGARRGLDARGGDPDP